MMGSLSFKAKAWWKLVHHRLSPTYWDNVLRSDQTALIASIINGYEMDVAKWIARKIYDRAVSTDIAMEFSCLLAQICLDVGVPEITGVDLFIQS